jgi:hypothetical protein
MRVEQPASASDSNAVRDTGCGRTLAPRSPYPASIPPCIGCWNAMRLTANGLALHLSIAAVLSCGPSSRPSLYLPIATVPIHTPSCMSIQVAWLSEGGSSQERRDWGSSAIPPVELARRSDAGRTRTQEGFLQEARVRTQQSPQLRFSDHAGEKKIQIARFRPSSRLYSALKPGKKRFAAVQWEIRSQNQHHPKQGHRASSKPRTQQETFHRLCSHLYSSPNAGRD